MTWILNSPQANFQKARPTGFNFLSYLQFNTFIKNKTKQKESRNPVFLSGSERQGKGNDMRFQKPTYSFKLKPTLFSLLYDET